LYQNPNKAGLSSFVGPEVLAQVEMEISVFWDITLCIPLKFGQSLRGKLDLLVQVEN
jgi:hypothetical protein